jgi:hypothetical protein
VMTLVFSEMMSASWRRRLEGAILIVTGVSNL